MKGSRSSDRVGDDDTRSRRCDHLVRLLFHRLKAESVALFRPAARGRALRLVALFGRTRRAVKLDARMPMPGALLAAARAGREGLWLREISPNARIDLPFQRTLPRSVRMIPFCLRDGTRYLLMVNYLHAPQSDPFGRIEPILRLFDGSPGAGVGPRHVQGDARRVPIQLFCRRVLAPFVDAITESATVRSLGLLLWDHQTAGGEILEAWGTSGRQPGRGTARFRLGGLDFRCARGTARRRSSAGRSGGEGIRYVPVRRGGEIVGNLSLQIDVNREEPGEIKQLSRLISWALERELGLIRRLGAPGTEADVGNPYRAVIRILDEWSNASRYNEYLSFGFVRLDLDGWDRPAGLLGDRVGVPEGIRAEIESALRKGDIFLQGSGRDVALIFPRTPPEGADSALRRLRNRLEGRVIPKNGGGVRVRNADFRVLSYPTDLPTEDILLERCCRPVLSG